MAKPHRHNPRQTKFNRPRTRPYAPNGLGGGSLSRFLPGRSGPTDADAGQTDVSVDPARRNDRMPRGRSSRRRRQRPRRRSTTLRLALQPLPTTASSRLQCRPTALTPAVVYDGDLVVSRRTLAPGLVRRANAAPCVLLATAHWNRSSQQTAAAALTMRSSTSPHTVSQTPRSHTQRTLSSPNSTQLHSARLFHTAAAHCKTRLTTV